MDRASHNRTDDSLIALRRILRATEAFSRELAQSAGVTPAQLRVLQIVEQRDGVIPKALAQQMRVGQATVTSLVDKLVAQGLVRRQPSEIDRRQTHVMITDRGRDCLRQAPDAQQQRYVRSFQSLSDWEQAQLVSSLERVAEMLDAGQSDASTVLDAGRIDSVTRDD
ncbi:MAG: MarR family transcriptional regulator [Minwuia sp.]|nr:MarR family transcriptional regulator [Minwuia sp.]